MFAAIVVSEATMFAGGGPHIAGGCGDSLRSQAVAWLGSALSTTSSFASQTASTTPEHEMAAVSLTSALTRRVPFETKPVLLSIGEAAEVARGNNHGAKARRLSYVESNGGVSRRDAGCAPSSGEDGDGSLEALIQVAQAALESPLLPLPVPSLSPPLPP
ncbi:unnamed protein product, partial [Sphacelaria rigidula]